MEIQNDKRACGRKNHHDDYDETSRDATVTQRREQLMTNGDNNYNKLFPPFKLADLFWEENYDPTSSFFTGAIDDND